MSFVAAVTLLYDCVFLNAARCSNKDCHCLKLKEVVNDLVSILPLIS